jgi:hypothetical protein
MMGNIQNIKNIPNCISWGTVTRDPDGVARGGGFDRGGPESAQNWLWFIQILHCKVAWLAQFSILSVLTL